MSEVIIDQGNTQPVSTDNYPYHFKLFNPVQSLTYPFKSEDANIVIGANTSSGKTICAEICMDETLKLNKRVIYLSPLRSLTREKYDDWQSRFSKYRISILTGDYILTSAKKKELGNAQIIVMTSEMMDSRTRKMESEKNFWLKEVGLVVVDEAHIISVEGRGDAVESGIMRFTAINKDARIMLLSATMPNVAELGNWLTDLNGKLSRVIYSTWRPVKLNIVIGEHTIEGSYWNIRDDKVRMALHIIEGKSSQKFLAFCHDKATGRHLLKILQERGIRSHFHNADLDFEERIDIEDSFKDRTNSGIRVLVSTSTLAWGRNLPARNVVIVGAHRGIKEVDPIDIIQMSGRAGRYGIDDQGFVYLIVPEGSKLLWENRLQNPAPVESTLVDSKVLGFHVLAEVNNKVITDQYSFLKWHERSLAHKQGAIFNSDGARYLFYRLENIRMIIDKESYYSLTGLGRVSSLLYYPPEDVYAWYKNFMKVFMDGIQNDLTLSWALTDIPSNDWGYLPAEVALTCDKYRLELNDYDIVPTNAIHFAVALNKSLNGGSDDESMPIVFKTDLRAIRGDIERVCTALNLIDAFYAHWKVGATFWKKLALRIRYGVDEELLQLVMIPGIGGSRARKLWSAGIHTVEDVVKSINFDKMMILFNSKNVASKIVEAAVRISRK